MARRRKQASLPDDGPQLPEGLIDQLAAGVKTPADFQAIYRQFQKALTERVLQAELTQHLGYPTGGTPLADGNARNGTTPKRLITDTGTLDLAIPRDRQSSFQPQFVPKGVRGRHVQTTRPDPTVDDPRDLVQRAFVAERPNQLWVADFTYVATWRGMVYVAFVIDVFSRRIVGWRAHTTMQTALVLDALEQALCDRVLEGAPGALVVHSDRGSQYVSMCYTERLAEAGAAPSVGSVGDAYDNALAESVIGLYKTEVVRRRGPWRSFDDVEFATLEWVAWFKRSACWNRSGTCPRRSTRPSTRRPWPPTPGRWDSTNRASTKPGAVHDTDSLSIDLSEQPSAESREVSAGIVLDYDTDGNLVGIDIDNASRKVLLQHLVLTRLDASIERIAG